MALLLTLPCCCPVCAQVLQGSGATREIGNKLVHEEQQKPSDLPDELRHGDDHGANPPGPMSSEDKHVSLHHVLAGSIICQCHSGVGLPVPGWLHRVGQLKSVCIVQHKDLVVSCRAAVLCIVCCAVQLQFLAAQSQQKAAQYDRNHPGRLACVWGDCCTGNLQQKGSDLA